MPKKEVKAEESKKNSGYNWTPIMIVVIVLAILLVIFNNDFSSGTGSAVRGSGSKKPDLMPGTDMQHIHWSAENYSNYPYNVLAAIQVGASVVNSGTARAKASVLAAGVEGVTIDFKANTESNVEPLMPNSGTAFTTIFIKLPIGIPNIDGTPLEQEYRLFSIADAKNAVSESNENNNLIERHFILRCAYVNYPTNLNPKCCVKPLGEWPSQFTPTIESECPR